MKNEGTHVLDEGINWHLDRLAKVFWPSEILSILDQFSLGGLAALSADERVRLSKIEAA